LLFGARNPELNVLNINDGKKTWSYMDSTGGWIIGDPVIDHNILYIGGSDNFKMYAFNPDTGKAKWEFNSKLNIYTKPIVTDKYVIFTAGNAYKPKESGKLIVLNKADGTMATSFEIPQASFSSPAIDANNIYFGAYDGVMYKLHLK
jgi:outer membrane protein assembly factor BamB